MRTRLFTSLTGALVLAAAPLLAQSGGTQAASEPALHHLTGVIQTLAVDKIEIKVESVAAEPEPMASGLVGNVETFRLDQNVQEPVAVHTGDRVDVAYTLTGDVRNAVRIDLVPASDSSQRSGTAATSATSPSAGSTEPMPSASSSSATSSTTVGQGEQGSSTMTPSSQPSSSSYQATERSKASEPVESKAGKLPQTASSLPLIALVGLAALLIAGVLRLGARA